MGTTARCLLAANPRSYVAAGPEVRFAARLGAVLKLADGRHVGTRAQATALTAASADVVVGEAMLTMQPTGRRAEIVAEAVRLLRPGGRYGIHELTAATDDPDRLADLRHDLSHVTRVATAPPPPGDWFQLLRSAGLDIRCVETLPLCLLTLRGVLVDEGPWRALVLLGRLARRAKARRRVRRTWAVHRHYRDTLRAIVMVAEKPLPTS